MSQAVNPYGPRPGGGISLPEYYQPWPAIKNRNMFLPGTEVLPENEMRITFLGSSPWPPNKLQKGTSILVELGNGTMQPRRFFFDLGNGSVGQCHRQGHMCGWIFQKVSFQPCGQWSIYPMPKAL